MLEWWCRLCGDARPDPSRACLTCGGHPTLPYRPSVDPERFAQLLAAELWHQTRWSRT